MSGINTEDPLDTYKNRDWLKDKLIKGHTHTEIASTVSKTRHTINKWVGLHGLRGVRKRGPKFSDIRHTVGRWLLANPKVLVGVPAHQREMVLSFYGDGSPGSLRSLSEIGQKHGLKSRVGPHKNIKKAMGIIVENANEFSIEVPKEALKAAEQATPPQRKPQ